MKYCKECKFVKCNWIYEIFTLGLGKNQWRFAKCSHIKAITKSNQVNALIAKELSPIPEMYCSTMRQFNHLCDEEAKYFETRPPLK